MDTSAIYVLQLGGSWGKIKPLERVPTDWREGGPWTRSMIGEKPLERVPTDSSYTRTGTVPVESLALHLILLRKIIQNPYF
jgi:hypothetical protein